MGDVKAKVVALVGEVDGEELAVRLIESMTGLTRPANRSARYVLSITDPGLRETVEELSRTAIQYIAECLNAGRQPS